MPMLKAIFCDVDGTLTGHKTKPVDAGIRKYIIKLRKRGVKFGTATSHRINSELTRKLSGYYKFDYMIMENGGVIYLRERDGTYKKLKAYEKENRRQIQHLAGLKKFFRRIAKKIKTSDPILTCENFYKIFYLENTYLRVCLQGETSFFMRPVSANDNITPVIKILRKKCREHKWNLRFIEPRRTFVQIGIANKANGVKYLAHYLGIPLKYVCAIGDADNDEEMLKIAGLPACPSDVSRKLKCIVMKRHGIVASEIHYLGVRQIVRQISRNLE